MVVGFFGGVTGLGRWGRGGGDYIQVKEGREGVGWVV